MILLIIGAHRALNLKWIISFMGSNVIDWLKDNTSIPIGKDAPRKLSIFIVWFFLIIKNYKKYEFLQVDLDFPSFYISVPVSAALAYFATQLANIFWGWVSRIYEKHKISKIMDKLSSKEFNLIYHSFFLGDTKSTSFNKSQSELYRMEKQGIVFRHGEALHKHNVLWHLNEFAWEYIQNSENFKNELKAKEKMKIS